MNGSNIALYAAIKTFYEKEDDSLATIALFVLKEVSDKDDITHIKQRLQENYKIGIPEDVLKTIFARLKKKGYIEYHDTHHVLMTEQGYARQVEINDALKGVSRDFTELVQDARTYLSREGVTVNDIEKAILDFIDNNIDVSAEVILKSKTENTSLQKVDSYIARYIIEIEKSDHKLFTIFQQIFFGRLYILLIRSRSEIDKNARFSKLAVYLDTNIVLSILGLDEDEVCRPIIELVQLLSKQENVTIHIYGDTLLEARNLLESCKKQTESTTSQIPINSLSSRLRRKGYDTLKISLLIEQLDEKLTENGISVDEKINPSEIQVGDFEARINAASPEDHMKPAKALKHDAIILSHTKQTRKSNRSNLLEKSKAIILSADSILNATTRLFSQEDLDFPLSLRPIDMANIIWIKNVDLNSAGSTVLRHTIMAYAREKLVTKESWDNFQSKLLQASKAGQITDEQISLIISAEETKRVLIEHPDKAPEMIINDEFVEKLKQERITLIKKEELSRQDLLRVDANLFKLAKRVALIVSIIFWFTAALLIGLILWFIISIFTLDTVDNIMGVFGWTLIFVLVLFFGDRVKPTAWVIQLRNGFYKKIFVWVTSKLQNYLKS